MKRPAIIGGIRDKLIVSFSALVAGIALFFFAFFPARLERQAMSATLDKTTAIREMAAYSLGAGLLFDDTVAVRQVLDGVAAARDVAFLSVWNSDGRLVASRGAARPLGRPPTLTDGEITPDGRMLIATIAVKSGATRVGTLALGISLASLHAEVAQARRIGALVSALILAIGILAIFAISTFVTRPLTAVAQTVNRIAQGDLQLRAAETTDVEVRQLVRAFNHMIDILVGTQAELASMNEKLEERVESRTAQLTQAVEEQRQSRVALALSENEARQTSELLQSLIDVAPQAIVAVDLEWRITRWNLAAERLFGWSASEVVGRHVPFVPEEQREAFHQQQLAMARDERREPVEVIRTRKDGSRISVFLAVGSLHDLEQRVAGFIGIFTDLTERKRLEEQLRQSQKMEAMGRLAGGVAHDFNNILTVIMACTELLLVEPRDEEEQGHLELIAGASARAASLTRQLLTFTRQQIVQLRPIDVGEVLRSLEPMLRRVLPANIQLTTTLPHDTGLIQADPSQLEQVMMNLVVNAADAMPQGGALDVHLRRVELDQASAAEIGLSAGRYNRLTVRDSGHGIDEKIIARVFEPFFTTKEVGKGTGLGLATTYAIVDALGGAIRVRSVLGMGTTFEIHMPESRSRAPAEVDAAIAPMVPVSALPTAAILLVEDEAAVRRVVRRSLERSGYRVLEAENGEQGIAIVAEHGDSLAAVVTDMMMPGMNGRDFAALLSASHPTLGVVCISGYIDSGPAQGPMLDANHVFLQKPFTRGQLVAAIESVAREASISAAGFPLDG